MFKDDEFMSIRLTVILIIIIISGIFSAAYNTYPILGFTNSASNKVIMKYSIKVENDTSNDLKVQAIIENVAQGYLELAIGPLRIWKPGEESRLYWDSDFQAIDENGKPLEFETYYVNVPTLFGRELKYRVRRIYIPTNLLIIPN